MKINQKLDHIIVDDGFIENYLQLHGIDNVYKYIMNQKEHHKKTSFKDEYLDFLNKFQVEFDDKYIFQWIEY